MNRVALVFTFILFACCHAAFAQEGEFNFKNAGDYNNFIMKEMELAVQKNFEYLSFSVHSEDYELMDAKRREVVDQINEAKDKIGKMPPMDGDTRLRDEAVGALEEYKNAFELDYRDIIGLKRKSKDSYEAMERYFKAEDKAEEKVGKATSRLRKAQQSYAGRNNMRIVDGREDDPLAKKMSHIAAVNAYWREIFLQYFKVSKEYDEMWDALSQEKPGPLEQQRVEAIAAAREALPLIKSKTAFNGDTEFRDQTINIVEYFLNVSQNDFSKIVEKLKQKSLTQQEVDLVNGIVNRCNADHERLAYNWNIASQDLFKKNVAKE